MSVGQRFTAQVYVFPRPEILDPQGKAIGDALKRVGFEEVAAVRAGKSFEIELWSPGREQAASRLEEMCSKLLANPIIEDYSYELNESPSGALPPDAGEERRR